MAKIDIPRRTKTVSIRGIDFTVQENTVKNQKLAADAARLPEGGFSADTFNRLMLLDAIVEPKLGAEDIDGLPIAVHAALVDAVNEVNGEDEKEKADPKA